jgi:hypothetical protein
VAQRRKRGEARGQRLMASGARPWRGEGGGGGHGQQPRAWRRAGGATRACDIEAVAQQQQAGK